MQDHEPIISAFQSWRGAAMSLATVTATWGSAPRPRGSHMLVCADGRFEGSVSGGCVEGDVLQLAAETMQSGRMQSRRYGVSAADAWEVGLPCGGSIDVIVQPVSNSGFAPHLFEAISEARTKRLALTISTCLKTGKSTAASVPGPDIFLNHYLPARRLIIVGAVQIAQSLSALASTLGVETTIIDPRSRFLTPERFPRTALDDRWPDEALLALAPDEQSSVVTLSHDPKIDDPALMASLRYPTGYIAALGSKRSHAARLNRLSAAGIDGATLSRIEGPAGVAIGALGCAEIAVSIAGGMIRALTRST